jgi:hypothetical protein
MTRRWKKRSSNGWTKVEIILPVPVNIFTLNETNNQHSFNSTQMLWLAIHIKSLNLFSQCYHCIKQITFICLDFDIHEYIYTTTRNLFNRQLLTLVSFIHKITILHSAFSGIMCVLLHCQNLRRACTCNHLRFVTRKEEEKAHTFIFMY